MTSFTVLRFSRHKNEHSGFLINAIILLSTLICFAPGLMAQTNSTTAGQWLSAAEIAPPFSMPNSLTEWETKRAAVRQQLWQLLGKLPPRPKMPQVQITSTEDR